MDDNNTTLIQYQGGWTYIAGSTRQWEGGVHSTSQTGASATFSFRGYKMWILGTVPSGFSSNIVTVTIDANISTDISRTSNGSAVYNEVYFASPLLQDTSHVAVVTYWGSTDNGNSEFLLDRFVFQTEDDVPTFPSLNTTSLNTGTTPTSSSNPPGTISPSSRFPNSTSSRKIPLSGIIAAIMSSLLIVAIFIFFLWRKRRPSIIENAPIPFPSSNPQQSEKGSHLQPERLPDETPNVLAATFPSSSTASVHDCEPRIVNHVIETMYDSPPSYQQDPAP